MNIEDRINELNRRYEKAKDTKLRAEWRMEELLKEEKELNEKISALGLEPESLEQEILKMETEIQALLAQAEKLLPEEI